MQLPQINFNHSMFNHSEIEIIELTRLYQRRENLDHDPSIPHRVNFYLLLLIEEGNGSHFIDFEYYPYTSGNLIFINKNQIHAFDFVNCPKGKLVLFTTEFIEKLQLNMRVPLFFPSYLSPSYSPILSADPLLQNSLNQLLDEIHKELSRKEPQQLIVMFLFSALLLQVARVRLKFNTTHLSKKQQAQFFKFIDMLENDLSNSRDASFYAKHLNITYKTLNQLCKMVTDITAKKLIDRYVILEAKRLLAIEQQPVQQIADSLGFDETTNFIKYFKKNTNHTPQFFRKTFV